MTSTNNANLREIFIKEQFFGSTFQDDDLEATDRLGLQDQATALQNKINEARKEGTEEVSISEMGETKKKKDYSDASFDTKKSNAESLSLQIPSPLTEKITPGNVDEILNKLVAEAQKLKPEEQNSKKINGELLMNSNQIEDMAYAVDTGNQTLVDAINEEVNAPREGKERKDSK